MPVVKLMLIILLLILCFNPSMAALNCNNPQSEWIACEDFENGHLGWPNWFTQSAFVSCNGCSNNQNDPARIRLTDNSGETHTGDWALYMPAEASANYRGASLTFRSCSGQKRTGCPLTGYEKLHFRTWIKLASDHEYVHHFLAIAGTRPNAYWESDGNAGCRPNGVRWAGTTLDFNSNHELFFYTYFPEMRCDAGGYCSGTYAQNICDGCANKDMPCENGLECCWGNHFKPSSPVILEQGQWVCLEMMMQLNTVGQSDGEMAFWVNGNLALHQKGMHWRDDSTLQLNKAWLQHYIAGGDASQSNRVWFDDVVVSTERIGCTDGDAVNCPQPAGRSGLDIQALTSWRIGMAFSLTLDKPGTFRLKVLDITGRKIWSHQGKRARQGNAHLVWNFSAPVSNGLYLVKLVQEDRFVLKKIVVAR